MRVWVIGPGALGLVFGLRLFHAGHEVRFIGRSRIRGLRCEEDGEVLEADLPVLLPAEVTGTPEIALLTTKAYSAKKAVEPLQDALQGIPLVLFQNGIGAQEEVGALLGPAFLVVAVTSEGGTRLAPGHVRHTGRGETVLGPLEPQGDLSPAERAKELLASAGFSVRTVRDIRPYRYTKLLVNAVINPLTALARVPNGALLHPEGWAAASRVGKEALRVLKKAGVPLLPGDPLERVREVLRRTASNRSSMLQDLEAGRPTEIEYITGQILRLAERHRTPAPLAQLLYALIKLQEHLSASSGCLPS